MKSKESLRLCCLALLAVLMLLGCDGNESGGPATERDMTVSGYVITDEAKFSKALSACNQARKDFDGESAAAHVSLIVKLARCDQELIASTEQRLVQENREPGARTMGDLRTLQWIKLVKADIPEAKCNELATPLKWTSFTLTIRAESINIVPGKMDVPGWGNGGVPIPVVRFGIGALVKDFGERDLDRYAHLTLPDSEDGYAEFTDPSK